MTQTYPSTIAAKFYSKTAAGDPNVRVAFEVGIWYAFKDGVIVMSIESGVGVNASLATDTILETDPLPIPQMPPFGFKTSCALIDESAPTVQIIGFANLASNKKLQIRKAASAAFAAQKHALTEPFSITALTAK